MYNRKSKFRTYYSSVQNSKGQETKRQIAVFGWDRGVCPLFSYITEGISILIEKSEIGPCKEPWSRIISSPVRPFDWERRNRDLREYRKINVLEFNIMLKKCFIAHNITTTHFYQEKGIANLKNTKKRNK